MPLTILRRCCRNSLTSVAVLLAIVTAQPLSAAITIQAPFNNTYSAVELGAINGLPQRYGGLTFKPGDPNTILIGGQANDAAGRFYEVPLIRDPVSRKITGFGTPVATGFGANNDGGVAYHPSGILLYSRYSNNEIGMVARGSHTQDRSVALSTIGVAASPGALTFVPADLNGGGRLKAMSYSGARFYDIEYENDGNGTFRLTAATQTATLTGGPEGMIYLPQGSPEFGATQTLLVTEYGNNAIAAYQIDAGGNPISSTRRVFLSGLTGGEGAAIDPVTGDFLFSTFGNPNQVVRVEGFLPPASVALASSANPAKETLLVTFTATISGQGSITGSVTFRDGSTPISGCINLSVASSQATCTTSALTIGSHQINATYSGNATNATGTGSLSQVINPLNTAPVAGPSSLKTVVNFALGGTLVGSDIDGDSLSFTLAPGSGPAHGTVTGLDPLTGDFLYTPNAGYTGADAFAYTVTEIRSDALPVLSSTGQMQITVLPPPPGFPGNRVPLPADDFYETEKGIVLTVQPDGVLANDVDLDKQPLKISGLPVAGREPLHGTVVATSGGGFTYTPDPGYIGVDQFDYEVSDGTDIAIATVNLIIKDNGVNVIPRAVDDAYNTPDNVPLTVASRGVLANDVDADKRQPLRVVLEFPPTLGTVSLAPNGGFTYTTSGQCSVADTQLTDSFTYLTSDGIDFSSPATVTITIHCTNQLPTSVNDVYSTPSDTELFVPASGILANDQDPESNPLQVSSATSTTGGALALFSDGSFRYQPGPPSAPGVNYQDSFTYRASDGLGESTNQATVTINVTAANLPPLAGNDLYTVVENTTLTIPAPGLLGNDIDPESHALTPLGFTPPANGLLHTLPGGGFEYIPNAGYVGLDSFTYRVSDGRDESNQATVSLVVLASGINAPPVAVNDAFVVQFGQTLSVPAPGLLANDSDPDLNQPVGVALLSQPVAGTVALTSGGGFNYTPAPAANCATDQQVSFTYAATDGIDDSSPATVTITIRCSNLPPSATADTFSTPRDTELVIGAPGLLLNDSDPDGNLLTAVITTYPASGALALQADGSFRYLPAPGFDGQDSFTYRVSDGADDSGDATVTIDVTPVNVPPLAGNDPATGTAYITEQNRTLSVPGPGVLANDIDPDGNVLSALLASQPAHGTLQFFKDGGFLYLPDPNYVGLDSFTYQASDGADAGSAATVVIQVTPAAVNTPPIASDDSYTGPFGQLLSVQGPGPLANDVNPDGAQPLRMVLATQPAAGGAVKLTTGGGFDYTPPAGIACTPGLSDTFTYFANDGTDNSASAATVTINLTCAPAAAPTSIPVMNRWLLLLLAFGVSALVWLRVQPKPAKPAG
ncbi:tandem-95 repeat protein [Parahaliea maris]|uniref:Tandem-95 repeat protein n=1 Tax=Parahaliea maris TaxID=2716870 RepID=A0A5C8ZUG8_9GAMM|nr:Ig-like domain-containing protein [Parahaliea maris]TXS92153.1 tandem-95 repeat protein [Parahaliea maris]